MLQWYDSHDIDYKINGFPSNSNYEIAREMGPEVPSICGIDNSQIVYDARMFFTVITPKRVNIIEWVNVTFLPTPYDSLLIEAERRIYASVNQPSLVQIMACHLDGAKPLSEPLLEYC